MAEEELASLLSGKGWPVPEEYDAGPPPPLQPARLRRNTCYVVMALLLNEKVSRAGGRVEAGGLPSSAGQDGCLPPPRLSPCRA